MSEKNSHIIKHIMSQKWLMQPEELEKLVAIASREYKNMEAVSQRRESRDIIPLNNVMGNTGIINFFGPSFKRANLFTEISGATNIEGVGEELKLMVQNPNIKSVVINFDSPGGEVAGVAELGSLIKDLSQIKPIVAHVSNMATSAAYWIASQTKFINMSPTAIVGSIGVVCTVHVDNEDDGTIEIVSKNAPNKRLGPKEEGFVEQVQSEIDDLEEVFIETVAEGRNTTVENVIENFGNGGVFVAKRALELGMADKISSFDSLIKNLNQGGLDMLQNSSTSDIIIKVNSQDEKINLEKGNDSMSGDDNSKQIKEMEKTLEGQSKTIDNLLSMSTGHREYMENLEYAQRLQFVALSNKERDGVIARNHDPVVYTTMDGEDIKASAGKIALEKAMKLDEMMKKNIELNEQVRKNILSARAEEELNNLPGTTEIKAELLGALDNIDPKSKDLIIQSLRAKNEEMKSAFSILGAANEPVSLDEKGQLDALVEKYAKDNKCSIHKARSEVQMTKEGADLYKKIYKS